MEGLRQRRQQAGLTQMKLAQECMVSLTTVRMWEYGMPPTPENEARLEEVLKDAESGKDSTPHG